MLSIWNYLLAISVPSLEKCLFNSLAYFPRVVGFYFRGWAVDAFTRSGKSSLADVWFPEVCSVSEAAFRSAGGSFAAEAFGLFVFVACTFAVISSQCQDRCHALFPVSF